MQTFLQSSSLRSSLFGAIRGDLYEFVSLCRALLFLSTNEKLIAMEVVVEDNKRAPPSLDDLGMFLNRVVAPGRQISAEIGVDGVGASTFFVTLRTIRSGANEGCVGGNKGEVSRTFNKSLDFLEVIQMLAGCPKWTRGNFVFRNERDFGEELNVRMIDLFELLRGCRSLSTLDIKFDRFYHAHLPRLLREFPFLETLILDAVPLSLPEHESSIAVYFEQKSVLTSCTLTLDSCGSKPSLQTLQTVLRPFMDGRNAALKKLIIRISPSSQLESGSHEELVCGSCFKAIAELLRFNTSLVKLDLCCPWISDGGCELVGSALEANHTLEEFGFPCTVAGLKKLVGPFIPNLAGLQANTSLSTLKLSPRSDCQGKEFVNVLAKMLESNTTLKHVLVSKQSHGTSWPFWDNSNLTSEKNVEPWTGAKLELMKNELSFNTSLQSLVVGNWTLRRDELGTQWKMTYNGPCLMFNAHTEKEYFVEVRMQR